MRFARHRKRSPASGLAAAARRFAILLAGTVGVTATASVLVGLAFGAGLNRSLTLGLYVVGLFLLVAGFFVGNRGPARLRDGTDAAPLGPRHVRWATADERAHTINESAIFVSLGFLHLMLRRHVARAAAAFAAMGLGLQVLQGVVRSVITASGPPAPGLPLLATALAVALALRVASVRESALGSSWVSDAHDLHD